MSISILCAGSILPLPTMDFQENPWYNNGGCRRTAVVRLNDRGGAARLWRERFVFSVVARRN